MGRSITWKSGIPVTGREFKEFRRSPRGVSQGERIPTHRTTSLEEVASYVLRKGKYRGWRIGDVPPEYLEFVSRDRALFSEVWIETKEWVDCYLWYMKDVQ